MVREKRNKLFSVVTQIVIAVAGIVISAILLGGVTEYSDIKENAKRGAEASKKVEHVEVWIHHHDSTETVRYIMDTVRQSGMQRELKGINKRLDKLTKD